jgi:poly-gamma-glutamate capsule biosynthesis protein CapA/YwtB (metallophosphatase superfamily)
VARVLEADPTAPLVAPDVAEQAAAADAFVLNLECCISARGARFADPNKGFFFRAPPIAAQRLAELGVDAVSLANNHVLDYGPQALLDTLAHLEAAGIGGVGAGPDEASARAPIFLRCGDPGIRLVAFSDHPSAYAAAHDRPGIAYANLDHGMPEWALRAAGPEPDADAVLVTPHWGPNMVSAPIQRVRCAAEALAAAGATLVAGHSAHVSHGAAAGVLFDLGDFLDDYAMDHELRNDLSLLWLVELDVSGPRRIRAVPLALDDCFTRATHPGETEAVIRLLRARCAPFGTDVAKSDGLLELLPV